MSARRRRLYSRETLAPGSSLGWRSYRARFRLGGAGEESEGGEDGGPYWSNQQARPITILGICAVTTPRLAWKCWPRRRSVAPRF